MKLILGPENKEPLIQILMALVRWFPDNQEEIKNLIPTTDHTALSALETLLDNLKKVAAR